VRLLWLGNPPWLPSGYGEQAGLFLPRIAAQGHEVAVLCNFGLYGQPTEWNGIPCYPTDGLWGNRNLPIYADRLRADYVLGLCDAWVLKPEKWPEGLRMGLWVPIDHTQIVTKVLEVLANDRIRPIAMSRFGEGLMRESGLEPLYVPHGVDTAIFRPQPELRDQVRDGLGIPRDAFLIGIVAANTSGSETDRKNFDLSFQAFARFAANHDDAWLYLHTDFKPEGIGFDLNVPADLAKCPPGRIRYPDPSGFQIGFAREHVALTYQAFDVLLHCSAGEGFGLAAIEAQACGIPVITSDHSAMPELLGAGWLVDGDQKLDGIQAAYFFRPFVFSIVDALEQAYEARGDTRLRAKATGFAQRYDADLVADTYWKPVLDELAGGASSAAPPARQKAAV